MKRLSHFFYERTNLLVCLVVTALMVGYASFVLGGFGECFEVATDGPSSLGLSFGYSYETAYQFFASRDVPALQCYIDFLQIWDSLFPLLYGLMYVGWISYLWRRFKEAHPRWWWINLYPLLMIFMDWTENIGEIRMTEAYLMHQTLAEDTVQLASVISMFKWTSSTICYIIILTGIVYQLKSRLGKSGSN